MPSQEDVSRALRMKNEELRVALTSKARAAEASEQATQPTESSDAAEPKALLPMIEKLASSAGLFGRCERCEHWDIVVVHRPDGRRQCMTIQSVQCDDADQTKRAVAAITEWDADGQAPLLTRGDFGCTLFVPKKDA